MGGRYSLDYTPELDDRLAVRNHHEGPAGAGGR
jgi:hypothetical protein